jgi:hypothetical protein
MKEILTRNGSITLVSGSSGRRPVRGYGVWTALHGSIEALAKGAVIDLAPLRRPNSSLHLAFSWLRHSLATVELKR